MLHDASQQNSLAAFADFILAHREEIVRHWVTAVDRSPQVPAADNLTYRQLVDHLPRLCTELADVLKGPQIAGLRDEANYSSTVHGTKRWEQGYRLEDLIRECCLIRKDFIGHWFDVFEEREGALAWELRRSAERIVHRFFDEVMVASTVQFVEEQQQRLRAAETAMLAEKQRAETEAEAKGRFISLVSHELRTPLTPMLLAAAALEAAPASAEVRELVRLIGHNARIEAMLIDDLLDASRLTQGELQLTLARVAVQECIDVALKSSALDFEMKRIVPELALAAEPLYLSADATRLARAFTALLRNAASVSAPGGRVAVTVRAVDAAIEVAIADCGPPFDDQLAKTIFLPFEEGRSSAFGMGGIGLSRYLCKATIVAHGGTLRAASAGQQGGAIFTATFPDART